MDNHGIKAQKIVGFGSDGASIMTGKKNGVATRMQDISPHCVAVHCFAHRLNLCTEKAANNVEYIGKTFNKILTDLFYYFRKSTARILELQELQRIFDDPQVTMKEVHEIRWFSFFNALQAVYKSYKSLVAYFKQHADKQQAAKDLLSVLTDYRFISTLHLMMDIIPSFAQLSMVFQKKNLDVATVRPAISGATDVLQKASSGKSYYQRVLDDNLMKKGDITLYKGHKVHMSSHAKSDVKTIRSSFCSELQEALSKRFPQQSTDVSTAFEILGMRNLSFLSKDDLEDYGNDKLGILIDHYGSDRVSRTSVKSEAIINPADTRMEWAMVKKVVLEQRYPRDSTSQLWMIIQSNHGETFPNLIRLAQIGLVVPLHTADCERGFSSQNNIHTTKRNRLEPVTLNRLMLIQLEGDDIEHFPFDECVKTWKDQKQRRIFSK